MANGTTLYRFQIELSDIDRGIYEPLSFRAALHPSETPRFLLTRVIAYALCFQEGIEFAPGGISDTEEPAIRVRSLDGRTLEWIEIGNPAAKKLHKATKSSLKVKVFAHKDPSHLVQELDKGEVHRASEIEVYGLGNEFLNELEPLLGRDNKWSLIHTDGSLTITTSGSDNTGKTVQGELRRFEVSKK